MYASLLETELQLQALALLVQQRLSVERCGRAGQDRRQRAGEVAATELVPSK